MKTLLMSFFPDLSSLRDKVGNIFSSFSFKDVIDIFIIACIIFLAARFLKGRKVGAIVIGIVICVAMLWISDIFGLYAIHTIFSLIIGSGPLVLIVIFQPEFRDMLEKIGKGPINGIMSFSDRRKKKELYNNAIDNICNAVSDMANQRTGSIIVIERTTGLGDVLKSGIEINADVNSYLLKNLFYDKAPLHDGAVVISDGRIKAAGCFLPNTRRIDIDPNLGSRHRAAIGMSERSDAIIIVVSEETGKISVAYDCNLKRDLTLEELKKFLMENILRSSFKPNEL